MFFQILFFFRLADPKADPAAKPTAGTPYTAESDVTGELDLDKMVM